MLNAESAKHKLLILKHYNLSLTSIEYSLSEKYKKLAITIYPLYYHQIELNGWLSQRAHRMSIFQ
jgi:hypothetical protein